MKASNDEIINEIKSQLAEKENKTRGSIGLCAADVTVKPVEYLWPDVFVRGALNGVQGVQGEGKTYMLCALSASVSSGGRVQSVYGGMERVTEGKVLYLSAEDDPETTLVPRLISLGANLKNVILCPEGIIPYIGSDALIQFFDTYKPALCVIDALQSFLPPGTNINSAPETVSALHPLKILASKYNTAVILNQHVGKIVASGNGGNYSVNYGVGSVAISGFCRSVWTLGRIRGDDGKPTSRASYP